MPFPGLASFGDDDADAALFYGRGREIAEVLEELRRVRADRDLRPFVILGAFRCWQIVVAQSGYNSTVAPRGPSLAAATRVPAGCRSASELRGSSGTHVADAGKFEAYGVIRDRLFCPGPTPNARTAN